MVISVIEKIYDNKNDIGKSIITVSTYTDMNILSHWDRIV